MTNRTRLQPSTLALALAAALPALAQAAPGADSAYLTDKQSTYVQDSTSKGVDQVNMITCVMSSMRPDALVNKGNYIALVDKGKCDTKGQSSTSNSGDTSGASSVPTYMTAVVNSTRASGTDPMHVKAWIDNQEADFSATIFANVLVTAPPDSTNPYGVFRLDYCGVATGLSGCMMQGYLQGATDGISYYEVDQGGGGGSQISALRLQTSGTDSGQGIMQISGQDGSGHSMTTAFTFAYNAGYFLRHTDGIGDQCFTRDASDPATGASVWSYGLYTADTGDRVNRNSNFPIEYTDPSGEVHRGNMGYYGLWIQDNVDVPDGATVQRVQYNAGSDPTRTPYTVVKSPGRLMKFTRQTKKLAQIDKIPFQIWIGDATNFYTGAQSNQQYQMYWDDSAGAFKVSATVVCNNGPCENHDLDVPQTVSPSFFANLGGVSGWSQALGGQLFIPLAGAGSTVDSSAIDVVYRTQDIVYPGSAGAPAALYCVNNCPTASTIGAYFAQGSTSTSPYVGSSFNNWMPTAPSGLVSYTLNGSGMLLDANSQAVSFTDKTAAQQHPQYQNGVMTGKLFTDPTAALCPDHSGNYCDYQAEQMPVYYQWQTGPNPWNQFAALKDANGNLVAFDPPLQVNYTVPSDARYGEYAGKSIVLQYGGFGDLWGIPGHCVSMEDNQPLSCDQPDARYVPAFAIPFDQTLGVVHDGNTAMLVKWLNREIRFAAKPAAACTAAGISLPTGLTLPDATGLQNPADPTSSVYIGAKPTVTDAPRVIQGVVEY